MEKIKTSWYHVLEKIGSKPRAGFPWVMRRVVMKWTFGECRRVCLIPASNEPSDCLQAFGDCRKGQMPRPLGHFKFDAPLLAAGYLIPLLI